MQISPEPEPDANASASPVVPEPPPADAPTPPPVLPMPKRKGRVGFVRKEGRFEAAEFVEGEPARGSAAAADAEGAGAEPPEAPPAGFAPAPAAAPAEGEEVGKVKNISAILEADRLRKLEAARRKGEAGEALTNTERAILAKADAAERTGSAGKPDGGTIPRVCADLDVWWVNGGGSTFYLRPEGCQWLELPREDLYSLLVLRGISANRVGDSPIEQHRETVTHIMQTRNVDRAIEGLAGFGPGIYEFKGHRVLVRKGPKLIEPAPGTWQTIDALLQALLVLEGLPPEAAGVQYDRFLHWLARAAANVHLAPPVHLNSQVLMLAGPAGAGKSLIQHLLLTPLLGGRSADPSRYLFGETVFNEGWMGCEHLLIEDPRPNVRSYDKLLFAQMLKSLTVNQEHSLHAKGKAEFGVPTRFVVSISINDDPDSIRILPKLTPDFLDKVMLFRVRTAPLPMPTRTSEERMAFQARVTAELPAFLHDLLQMRVPERLQSSRFGVLHYQNPDLVVNMSEDAPEGEFLHLLDHATIKADSMTGSDKSLWELDSSHSAADYLADHPRMGPTPQFRFLQMCAEPPRRVWIGSALELQDIMSRCTAVRAWNKIVDHNSIRRLLERLEQDRSDRVATYKSERARLWLIAAPEPDGPEPDTF